MLRMSEYVLDGFTFYVYQCGIMILCLCYMLVGLVLRCSSVRMGGVRCGCSSNDRPHDCTFKESLYSTHPYLIPLNKKFSLPVMTKRSMLGYREKIGIFRVN